MSRLSRRTPLRRGAPLARGTTDLRRVGLARGTGLARRTPLRAVSPRRAAERRERDEVRAAVFARDHRCRMWISAAFDDEVPRCGGPLTVHHIRKASQGGPYTRANLVALCAHHNDWLETFEGRRWGVTRGLVCPRLGNLTDCWVLMRAYGIVSWDPDDR